MSAGDRGEIGALLKLAHDKSASARATLMNQITDLFLAPEGRLTEHERALMTDILSKLLSSIEVELKRNLSDALLRSGVRVPELHVLLANDEIEVAEPVLRRSGLLADQDLIEIVRNRSDEHRIAIALRAKLSEPVADALVAHGNDDVVEALIRNQDAVLSQKAMQYLVAESRRIDRFQEPLLSRDDLPAEMAHRMYWWVSASLRRHILGHFDVDDVVLDDAIEDAAKRALAKRTDENSAILRAQQLVRQLARNGELNVQFMMQSLRQQRINIFVAALAEKADLSFRVAWRVISDRGFESFVITAKAIGIERNDTIQIVLLLAQAQNPIAARRPEVLNTIIELYDRVTHDRAIKVLKIWQRDIAYQEAIDRLAENAKCAGIGG